MSYKLRETPSAVGFAGMNGNPFDTAPVATYNDEASAVAGVKQRWPGCTARPATLGPADAPIVCIFIYKPWDASDPWGAFPVGAQPARAFLEVDPAAPFNPNVWA